MKRVITAAGMLLVTGIAVGCQGPSSPTAATSASAAPAPVAGSSPPAPLPVSSPPAPLPDSSPPAPLPDSFAEGTQPSNGPLVFIKVIDWLGEQEVSHTGVTFHLTEHCAYLYSPPDKPVLLVWPDGLAWVDPASPSTVHFRQPMTGKLVRLTDGQRVNLGGYLIGGQSYTYDPPPHSSCPTGGTDFAIQEVR
ncbi:hypothetical protein AB0F81_20500 [Actinoplanes sp. NPDC024001]|uniref:hypothetical protein n=1 Tax=Actinoplanes sp. NPDC024001 TaxID=3154598 RepID=UPI0033C2D275